MTPYWIVALWWLYSMLVAGIVGFCMAEVKWRELGRDIRESLEPLPQDDIAAMEWLGPERAGRMDRVQGTPKVEKQ